LTMGARAKKRIVRELTIKNMQGLHLRASSKIVHLANKFRSDVLLAKDGQEVNGKSIMSIATLAAPLGSVITVRVEGPDAKEAIEALTQLFEEKFGER